MSVASLICYVSRLKEDAGDGSSEETDASESTCDSRNGCGIYNNETGDDSGGSSCHSRGSLGLPNM